MSRALSYQCPYLPRSLSPVQARMPEKDERYRLGEEGLGAVLREVG